MPPIVRLLVFLLVLLSVSVSPAWAQPAPGSAGTHMDDLLRAFPGGLTPEQVDAVLAVMDDEAIRTALRRQLLAPVEPAGRQVPPAPVTPLARQADRLHAVMASYPLIPQAVADAFRRPHGRDAAVNPTRLVLSLLFLFGMGVAALVAFDRLVPAKRASDSDPSFGPIIRSVGRDLARTVVFAVGLLLAYAILRPAHPAAPAIFVAALQAGLTVLVADLVFRFLCAPERPDLRLVPLGEKAARAIHRAAVVVALLTAVVVACSTCSARWEWPTTR